VAATRLTTGAAFERLRVALEQYGSRVTGTGSQLSAQCPAHDDGQLSAQCPAHDDGHASLSVTGIAGQVLVHCHAGCDTGEVLAAVGLRMADLFDEARGVTYRYGDGRVVHRSPSKAFYQSGNTKGVAIYRADEVKAAIAAGQTVWVAEGEKDCAAMETLGVTATCSVMGAGKAAKFDWSPLTNATVIIVADKDEPGKKHARDVRRILHKLTATVRIVEAASGKDAADHIAAGHGVDDFVPLALPDDTPAVGNPGGRAGIPTVHGGGEPDDEYVWPDTPTDDEQRLTTVTVLHATGVPELDLPNLPMSFWDARPILAHIRDAAWSRNRAADVALHGVLTRLAGIRSHRLAVDTGIGDHLAGLNLFSAVVGGSGTGKSSGLAVAARLITVPMHLDCPDGIGLGSG
jgi:hypothetical protein